MENNTTAQSQGSVTYTKDISDFFTPYFTTFVYRSVAEIGEKEFMDILTKASAGDPEIDMTDKDGEEIFEHYKNMAKEKFNPGWWKVAYDGDKPVGAIMPQIVPGTDDEGTILYIGVLPDYRGKGYGSVLHAAGLDFMSRNGIKKYSKTTSAENEPMIKILESNGCERA